MLRIVVPAIEGWDEQKEEFVTLGEDSELQLEHSLFSISKWEAKHEKAFLGKQDKSYDETIDYIRCMTLNEVDPRVYSLLTKDNVDEITKYIQAPMSATYIAKPFDDKGKSQDTVTSELIYYWMIAFNIPFECQHWHLNRLLKLIEVCEMKTNSGSKKVNPRALMKRNASLNAQRRRALHSKG